MRNAIVDKSDIRVVNSNAFKRATITHKDFPNAKLYMHNCSLDRVVAFFAAIGVTYSPNIDRYNVLNTQGECIIVDVYENIQERYIGYSIFI